MGRGAWRKTPEKKKLQEKQGVREKDRARERGWRRGERKGGETWRKSVRDRGKQMPWIPRTFECVGEGEGGELGGEEGRGGEGRETRQVSSPCHRPYVDSSCAAPSRMGPCSGMQRCRDAGTLQTRLHSEAISPGRGRPVYGAWFKKESSRVELIQ